MKLALSYVLPLRWASAEEAGELASYVDWLVERVADVIVIDGSVPAVFGVLDSRLPDAATHVAPDPDLRYVMGKVNGVESGLRRARYESVIVADDDIRYDEGALRQVAEELARAEVVRPHNYFRPMPWHAHWDTGRTLINRAVGGDYPGTLGVRRSLYRRMGGYDGDVMFENLELMRTAEAAGGRVVTRLDVLVRRRPPTTRHFLSQRVRQAYDDFALPARMAAFLSVLPALATLAARRRWRLALALAAAPAVVAELGRRRAGGAAVYPATGSLLAPAWVLERAVCAWLAVLQRLARGGVRYGEVTIRRSATPKRELRRRLAARHHEQGEETERVPGPAVARPGARVFPRQPDGRNAAMSGEPSESAAQQEDQQRDKEEFQADPRGAKEVSDQQGEAQPSGGGAQDAGSRDSGDDKPDDRHGGDDPGQATGNPANAG